MLRKWLHLVATFPGSQLGKAVVITNFTLPTKWTFMIISIYLRSNDYNRTHKHTPTHISPNTHTHTNFLPYVIAVEQPAASSQEEEQIWGQTDGQTERRETANVWSVSDGGSG